jgi:hypothetical protein
MHVAIILGIGAALGAVSGAGIFFADGEPYKIEIFIAATLKGMFISFVTAISLHAPFFVWQTALVGAIYGFVISLVVFFAKGAWRSKDAPYILPSGLVTGGLIGLLIALFAPV